MAMNPRLLRPTANDSPASIPGLALWLDASASDALYTTDAGPVTAVSSPLDISGCALWLDASRTDKMWNATSGGSLVANGGAVLRLDDLSGNGKHLIQATSASAPVRQDAAVGSLAALDFAGGKFATAGDPGDWNFLHSTQGGTVFVALRPSNVADPQTFGLVLSTNANSSSLVGFGVLFDDRVAGYNRNNYLTTLITHGTSGQVTASTEQNNFFAAADAVSIATVVCSAGAAVAADRIRARRDGVLLGSNNTQTFTPSSSNSQTGLQVGGGGGEIGDIAEIIVYDSALSTSDRARVEAYLAAKWGISGVHAPAVTASDPVGYWRDRSGNGRHATQSTAASRPVVGTVNSRKALTFDGSNDFMSADAAASVFAGTDTPWTVLAAIDMNSTANSSPWTVARNDAFAGRYLARVVSNTWNHLFTDDSGLNKAIPTGTPVSLDPSVLTVVKQGATASISVLGATVLSGADASGTATPTTYTIGAHNNLGGVASYSSLNALELLAYSRALSTAERRKVEVYLARRWGITLAPQVSNAEAQDWISRVYAAGSTVSQPVANAVSAFVDGCQADGIWDAMKSVVLLAGADTLAGALAPLKGTAPTSYNFASGDYNKASGLKGDGSSTYLQANRNEDADGLNDNHYAAWTTTLGTGVIIANNGVANTTISNVATRNRSSSFDLLTTQVGFIGISRIAAGTYTQRTGGENFTVTRSSVSAESATMGVFASGAGASLGNHRISYYSMGSGLNLALLDARVSALMTAIGVS